MAKNKTLKKAARENQARMDRERQRRHQNVNPSWFTGLNGDASLRVTPKAAPDSAPAPVSSKVVP